MIQAGFGAFSFIFTAELSSSPVSGCCSEDAEVEMRGVNR